MRSTLFRNPTTMTSMQPPNRQTSLDEIDRLPDPEPRPNRLIYRRIRLSWVFLSILGNCLTAAGVAIFPLVAPYISHRFGLDQSRTNTIVLGGICGQYFTAALVGGFADVYGPRSSLLASLLNILGYGSLTALLSLSPKTASTPSLLPLHLPIHLLLALAYAFIGAGSISAYFSSLKASTLNFPSHPSLAIAIPLSCFGLSSAFLAALSSSDIFTDAERPGELDGRAFCAALVLIVGGWNLFAAAGLKVMPDREENTILQAESAVARLAVDGEPVEVYPAGTTAVDEEMPLLGGKKMERGSTDLGLLDLLKTKDFWCLGIAMFLIIGPAEMLVNSIGSIITSLLIPVPHSSSSSSQPTSTLPSPLLTTLLKKHHPSGPSPHQTRQSHVQLISITNTLSRLFIGFIADYFSSSKIPPPPPPATASSSVLNPADTDPEPPQPVRYQLSKVTLLLGVIAFLITPTYLWSAIGLHSIGTLWVLTGGVGTAYGALFTLTPTITAQVFGLKTFGRNFGILSYFCAISSLIFTYIFSSLADSHALSQFPPVIGIPEEPARSVVCAGKGCFEGTMWIAMGSSILGGVVLWWIGRGWKARGV